jgi:hypothetical protein
MEDIRSKASEKHCKRVARASREAVVLAWYNSKNVPQASAGFL